MVLRSSSRVHTMDQRGHIFIFDTETTGLPPRGVAPSETNKWRDCRIVQIAWELYSSVTHELITRECYIVRPDGFDIPDSAAQIHGITTARATEEGIYIKDVFAAIRAQISSFDTVVAHNVAFDDKVLLSEMHRYDQQDLISAWTSKTKECTMLIGANGKKWPKLIELYHRLFGEEEPGVTLHRADADVALCAKCYFKLRN